MIIPKSNSQSPAMEPNQSHRSSGDFSPLHFDHPPSWEEPPPATTTTTTYKVKFMCSYGGKIQPRPHDNHLSYFGGDTKILSIDRATSFSSILSKLSSIVHAPPSEICLKYQLPGEDLDALISVTNDEDLEHLMSEYDRLNRSSPKPARLRIFLNRKPECGDWFVDALNSVQLKPLDDSSNPNPNPANPDFLFGFDKAIDYNSVTDLPNLNDQAPAASIQSEMEKSHEEVNPDVNTTRIFQSDYYQIQEKVSPQTVPGYWPEMQPIYLIQTPTGAFYHQNPYSVQRMMPEPPYREHSVVYNGVPPSPVIQQPPKVTGMQPLTPVSYVDSAGRPIYFTMAPPPPYKVVNVAATAMGVDSKVVVVGGKAPHTFS